MALVSHRVVNGIVDGHGAHEVFFDNHIAAKVDLRGVCLLNLLPFVNLLALDIRMAQLLDHISVFYLLLDTELVLQLRLWRRELADAPSCLRRLVTHDLHLLG